jgi:hypothetical protein
MEEEMKILYVEDELSKNIPKIINLFGGYLNKEIVKQLSNFEEDGFGASESEIRVLVNKSNMVHIEYTLLDTLKVIKDKNNTFTLLIIDRNLSCNDIDQNEIRKIDPAFTEEMNIKYLEREGDYLLLTMIYEGFDILNRFYFLTANSHSDLRNLEEVKTHIDYGKFSSKNIIDKSDNESIGRLKTIIHNIKDFNFRYENLYYLNFLEDYVGTQASDEFMELLKNGNMRTSEALTSCRRLLEGMLNKLAQVKAPINKDCWHYTNNYKELKLSTFIKHITFEEPQYYYSNTIIELALKNIQKITSEYGAHQDLTTAEVATRNTVQALIYNLKDIILWLKKVHFQVDKYS